MSGNICKLILSVRTAAYSVNNITIFKIPNSKYYPGYTIEDYFMCSTGTSSITKVHITTTGDIIFSPVGSLVSTGSVFAINLEYII